MECYITYKLTQVTWYKNTTRTNEIKMLMQGLSVPQPTICASSGLPNPKARPTAPPHDFDESDDTRGQAKVRRDPSVSCTNTTCTTPTLVSRTTQWRQRRKAGTCTTVTSTPAVATTTATTHRIRKEYCCRICGRPMSSTDHSQFHGQRYCPNAFAELSKEEWLQQRRAEAKEKAASKSLQ